MFTRLVHLTAANVKGVGILRSKVKIGRIVELSGRTYRVRGRKQESILPPKLLNSMVRSFISLEWVTAPCEQNAKEACFSASNEFKPTVGRTAYGGEENSASNGEVSQHNCVQWCTWYSRSCLRMSTTGVFPLPLFSNPFQAKLSLELLAGDTGI